MTRIGHLSDTHLNGTAERWQCLVRALDTARCAGCDHVLLTGDLTASGHPNQFLELAAALRGYPDGSVTMVPGNHDAAPGAWEGALAGPLHRFARTSSPGAAVDLGDVVVVAVDTRARRRAPAFCALGQVSEPQLQQLHWLAQLHRSRAIVLAMHHGPQWHPLHPFDGLTNRTRILRLLQQNPHVTVCCGHDHRILDLGRIFTAASVAEHPDPLRIYEIRRQQLVPVYRSEDSGAYMKWPA